MILGDFTSHYIRHTKGLQMDNIKHVLEQAVASFARTRELWHRWANEVVGEEEVEPLLKKHFGKRLGSMLTERAKQEQLNRSPGDAVTKWHVYSALTYYATHVSDEFPIRDTGNDHKQATLMKRAHNVAKLVRSEAWYELGTFVESFDATEAAE